MRGKEAIRVGEGTTCAQSLVLTPSPGTMSVPRDVGDEAEVTPEQRHAVLPGYAQTKQTVNNNNLSSYEVVH